MQEDVYWQAVLKREPLLHDTFVYAVRSTGIYCLPTCPSRRPRRAYVLFFAQPSAAEQAGFRPCRRCRPDEELAGAFWITRVQAVCTYIESHLAETLSLADLALHMDMSPYHIQRTFKRIMGITPRQYAEARRLQHFKEALRTGESITSALYSAGYNSSSRLYERVSAQLGMTPTAYRQGGQGMHISYTLTDCPLAQFASSEHGDASVAPWRLLVAASEQGICAISMGGTDEALEAALRDEYPRAQLQQDQADLRQWVERIVRHLQGDDHHLDLPLDLQATAFQWRVWQALQSIPYGETRSYSEIAQTLGDARKARAVARACASNPVALAIPCHRVIRGDGALGGYRWGIGRKELLLRHEQNMKM